MMRQPGALGARVRKYYLCFRVPNGPSHCLRRWKESKLKKGTMSRNIEHFDERIAGVLKAASATSTIHITLQGKGGGRKEAWSRAYLLNTSAITARRSIALTAIQ